MTHEETLANVQVAHLFLKAADQAIIRRDQAETALHSLFPGHLSRFDEPLAAAVRDLLGFVANDKERANYSLNVRNSLANLERWFKIPSAVLKLPDGITEEEAKRFRDEWVRSHSSGE